MTDLRPYGYAPGDYMMRCRECGGQAYGVAKYSTRCLACATEERRLREGVFAGCLLRFRLIKTTRRLTFDIDYQHPKTIYAGPDDGQYFKFVSSNGYEVISRSRMDIQTERIWLLGAKHEEEQRSGTMVFSDNEKRDIAYRGFIFALNEWATKNGGRITDIDTL